MGFPFGCSISKEDEQKLHNQMEKFLLEWGGTRFYLAGKILVVNYVILASIWYLCSCSDLTSSNNFKKEYTIGYKLNPLGRKLREKCRHKGKDVLQSLDANCKGRLENPKS